MKKILVALAVLLVAAAGFYFVMEQKDTLEREEDSGRRSVTTVHKFAPFLATCIFSIPGVRDGCSGVKKNGKGLIPSV